MEPLSPALRRELRARAHHLHPVVSIGHHGLTPAVLHEADVALTAHELIKVRVFGDERGERGALLVRICDALDCAAVQQIGKLLVLWRPRPPEAAGAADETPRRRKPASGAVPSVSPMARRRRAVAGAAIPAAWPPAPGDRRRRRGPEPRPPAQSAAPKALRGRVPGPGMATPAAVAERRRIPAGKAPAGVPRAAAPRRRRRSTGQV